MPRWALLSRVWLDGWSEGNHGKMGWVVAITDSMDHTGGLLRYLERQPHSSELPAVWHPPLFVMGV